MSGNLTAVREMSGILLKIREVSEKKILSGKSCLKLFIVNCIFVSIQVLVKVYSVLNVQYIMVSDRVLYCCISTPTTNSNSSTGMLSYAMSKT